MTGPEHYRRAEDLLAQVEQLVLDDEASSPALLPLLVAAARTHTELARVALAANVDLGVDTRDSARWEWSKVLMPR